MTPVTENVSNREQNLELAAQQSGALLGRVVSEMMPLFGKEGASDEIVGRALEKLVHKMTIGQTTMVQRAIEAEQEECRAQFVFDSLEALLSITNPEVRARGIRVFGFLPAESREKATVANAVTALFKGLLSTEQSGAVLRTMEGQEENRVSFLLDSCKVAEAFSNPDARAAAIETLGLFPKEETRKKHGVAEAIIVLFNKVSGEDCRKLFRMMRDVSRDRVQILLDCQRIAKSLSNPQARIAAVEAFLCLLPEAGMVNAVAKLFEGAGAWQAGQLLQGIWLKPESERAELVQKCCRELEQSTDASVWRGVRILEKQLGLLNGEHLRVPYGPYRSDKASFLKQLYPSVV